ncbi:hypothetical protein GCM10022419_108160 [Nonomuraea rosea]|uniref:Cholesterol esterase n=1 Tax=Nonomuraea rosea TaxID=638574 RepID=A0ABP6ZD11_9ACTN
MSKVIQRFTPPRTAFAAVAAGALMTLTLSSAAAGFDAKAQAPTWTVPMSGIATGTGQISAQVVQAGWFMSCNTVEAKVSARRGTGLPGEGVIAITGITFAPVGATCAAPFGATLDVTADVLPLKFNATAFDAATGKVAGRVSGISVGVESSDGCVLTATGQADATYDNSSGAILVEDTDHVRIATVNARCIADGLKVGHNVIVEGRFDLAPRGVITSP